MKTSQKLAETLQADQTLCQQVLHLGFEGYACTILSNSPKVLQNLATYFSGYVCETPSARAEEICVLDAPPKNLGISFQDWAREPGKQGRKDAISELSDGRLIHKVRTGMIFLQSQSHRIASGPCLDNLNQVINFITSQHMNELQNSGALICHAAGVVIAEHCLAIAGLSGGGKSTLMLHLLREADAKYLTNDRLFVRPSPVGFDAVGIAKLPRINPGTIVHNPALTPLLPETQIAELMALPTHDLWTLEDKHDVPVSDLYGPNKMVSTAPLSGLIILNWSWASKAPLQINHVVIRERPDLLPAIMKSPGPFYQKSCGRFSMDTDGIDPASYLSIIENIPIYEASGCADFAKAAEACLTFMRQNPNE